MKTVYKDQLARCVVFVLAMAAWSLGVSAQEDAGPNGTIRLRSGVSTTEITIGDRFTYHLTLMYEEGFQVSPPEAGENLGHFEIKDFQIQTPRKNEEGLMEQRFEFLLSTFTTGEYIIPPVSVAYTDEAGGRGELQSQPITVTVKSVLPEDAEDIRDIKKTAAIERDNTALYILIGAAVLLLAAVVMLIFWLRRRKRRREAPPAGEHLPPHLRAFVDLDALCRENLLEAGEFKAFYVRFADIFLTYLSGRFGVRTFERTTTEILEDLPGRCPGASIPGRVREILDECDLVKFAKYIPTLPYAESIVERARVFIRETAEEDATHEPVKEAGGGEPVTIDSASEGGAP